jgi:hypothetical protein
LKDQRDCENMGIIAEKSVSDSYLFLANLMSSHFLFGGWGGVGGGGGGGELKLWGRSFP